MDSRAIKLIDMVLKHEGGYSSGVDAKSSGDAGGRTYRGITQKGFPRWPGWRIVDAHMPLKYNQIIKDATLENYVREFYYKEFYLKMKADKIESECLAGHVFCHGVNAGVYTGVKLLQKAINAVYGVNIVVDGKIGAVTLQYANGDKQDALRDKLVELRNKYYRDIVARKPSQKKFLNGWLNRVAGTTKTCCGSSAKNVFLTLFKDGDGILEKILGFIFDVIKLFKS